MLDIAQLAIRDAAQQDQPTAGGDHGRIGTSSASEERALRRSDRGKRTWSSLPLAEAAQGDQGDPDIMMMSTGTAPAEDEIHVLADQSVRGFLI